MKRTLISLLCAGLIGCAIPKYHRVYNVTQDFQVILKDRMHFQDLGVGAYMDGKRLFIPTDDGVMPDFYYLGHELWHLKELGGRFHK